MCIEIDLTQYDIMEGNSKGNLVKWHIEDRGLYVKAGRISTRDYPDKSGIEPIIEVICFRLAKAMKIPCAEQKLGVGFYRAYGRYYVGLITISPDFKNGWQMTTLNQLYASGVLQNIDYNSIVKASKTKNELDRMMLFDYVIANEDRHNENLAWLNFKGNRKFSPLYDHGYSLLYDDINGMIYNKERATRFCQCNAFYGSFSNILSIIKSYDRAKELCNIGIRRKTIETIVTGVMNEYTKIINKYNICNIRLSSEWFIEVINFIEWRIDNVRNL